MATLNPVNCFPERINQLRQTISETHCLLATMTCLALGLISLLSDVGAEDSDSLRLRLAQTSEQAVVIQLEDPRFVNRAYDSFQVAPNGSLVRHESGTIKSYDIPFTLSILGWDAKVAESLRINQETIDECREEIRKFLQAKDTASMTKSEYKDAVERLEIGILRRLPAESQSELRAFASRGSFYALGPIEFARLVGVKDADLQAIQRRMPDAISSLERELLAAELRAYREIWSQLPQSKKKDFLASLKDPKKNVFATNSVLLTSLVELSTPKGSKQKTIDEYRYPVFSLRSAGYLVREPQEQSNSLLLSFQSKLRWLQQASENHADVKQAISAAHNHYLNSVSELRRIQQDHLREGLELDKNAEVNLQDLIDRDAIKLIVESWDADLISLLEEGKILWEAKRRGPHFLLSCEETATWLGVEINDEAHSRIAEASDEIRKSLVVEIVRIEKKFVEKLFVGIVDDSKAALNWQSIDVEAFPPPLEVVSLWKDKP